MDEELYIPPAGRIVQAIGEPAQVKKIAEELAQSEFQAGYRGDTLAFRSSEVDTARTQNAAQWAGYELVRVISESAHLYFGALHPLRFDVVITASLSYLADAEHYDRTSERPSLLSIIRVVLRRERLRSALFSSATGGADDLFAAYRAIFAEISDAQFPGYVREHGVVAWLADRSWITVEDDDRFFTTILHYRGEGVLGPTPASPGQAESFVRGLLRNVILFCARQRPEPSVRS